MSMQLSIQNLEKIKTPGVIKPGKDLLTLPEKVLQFGTGVLLRGLPDYFIDKANRQGIFNGRIVFQCMSTWIAMKFNTNLNHFGELRPTGVNCPKTGPPAALMSAPQSSLLQKSTAGALNWYPGGRLDEMGQSAPR